MKELQSLLSNFYILLFSTQSELVKPNLIKENELYNRTIVNLDMEFVEWLVGFSEAEGNFLIRSRKTSEGVIRGFEFLFRIALHLDDLETLKFIKHNLGCGVIKKDRNTYVLIVYKLSDIELKIFPVFDLFHLNSTKYLNYLSFKEAFYMYKNRTPKKSENVYFNYITEILKLKNSMNDKRICFSMPNNHRVRITKNYLLGFIEGDGSFYLYRNNFYTYISIGMESNSQYLLENIREFLLNQLDSDSRVYAEHSKLVTIVKKYSTTSKKKDFSIIQFYQIDFINNIIIPMFDHLTFHSKKYKDFLDFKLLVTLIYQGKHLTNEGKEIIISISNRMNNNRLSTNFHSKAVLLDEEKIKEILELEPLIEIDNQGRVRDKKNNKYIRKVYIIETFKSIQLKFPSAIACSEFFNLPYYFIIARLNDGKPFNTSKGEIKLKRTPIFKKK